MLNLTLAQVFGAGATQDATTLTIRKSDLPGLTAAVDNRGEQLLAALLLQLHKHFEGFVTDQQGNRITDPAGTPLTYSNHIYQNLDASFWKRQFINGDRPLILDTFVIKNFTLY